MWCRKILIINKRGSVGGVGVGWTPLPVGYQLLYFDDMMGDAGEAYWACAESSLWKRGLCTGCVWRSSAEITPSATRARRCGRPSETTTGTRDNRHSPLVTPSHNLRAVIVGRDARCMLEDHTPFRNVRTLSPHWPPTDFIEQNSHQQWIVRIGKLILVFEEVGSKKRVGYPTMGGRLEGPKLWYCATVKVCWLNIKVNFLCLFIEV